ncbi:MAG: uroporphyrinogen decarboxylase family protein [Nitrososphaerota archaeon]
MMTPRERIKAVINFRKPDVLPWCEKFYDETIVKWLSEGLPGDKVIVIDWEVRSGAVSLLNWPIVKGFDAYSYFGCYNYSGLPVPVDLGPIPRFKQRTIRETDRYADVLTQTGAVARRLKQAEYIWYNMPMFLSFPVKDRESWEDYKRRLDPHDPRRYPKDWNKDTYIEAFDEYQKGGTALSISGFYGFGAQLMGIPTFISMFYKDPEFIEELANYWEFFTVETVKDAVETLNDRIDIVFWWEDMAEKHGPCISPKLYREFLLPRYRRVTGFFNRNKIDRVLMDSDGNVSPLLDLIIEAGITGLWPLEVNAGMDAISIRKKYEDKLFLIGNLDKRELAKGGARMRREVDSKVPKLKAMGGYIPGADHLIPIEFSFEKFKEYAEYIRSQLAY